MANLGPFTEKVTAFILKKWHFSRCFAASDKIKAALLYKEKCKCTFLSSRQTDRPWLVFVPKQNASQSSAKVTESIFQFS